MGLRDYRNLQNTMTDTTTIEITHDQKELLDDMKMTEYESYKSVIQRLIEHKKTTQD